MKRLDNLIRVRTWQLNESRRRVTELELSVESTRARIQSLERSIEVEGRLADEAGVGSDFAAWAVAAGDRREKLNATLDTLDEELRQARDAVAEAFQELKKFELVQDARRQRHRAVANRREQFRLDEMAALRHRESGANR